MFRPFALLVICVSVICVSGCASVQADSKNAISREVCVSYLDVAGDAIFDFQELDLGKKYAPPAKSAAYSEPIPHLSMKGLAVEVTRIAIDVVFDVLRQQVELAIKKHLKMK